MPGMSHQHMERAIKGLLEREDKLAEQIVKLKEVARNQERRITFLEAELCRTSGPAMTRFAQRRLDIEETTSLGRSRTGQL